MLVFVDESGDAGRKTHEGSSRFFIVTTVVFTNRDEAQKCDSGIGRLRQELGLPQHKEFHFNKDCDRIRKTLLRAMIEYDFFYGSVVLNKEMLTAPGFNVKESLYKYTVRLAFQNILPELDHATVVFDRCGGREFTQQLRRYLRRIAAEATEPGAPKAIKKVRDDRSCSNNLLQMADMVCGAVARSYNHRPGWEYRRIIRSKERRVQVWPKLRDGA